MEYATSLLWLLVVVTATLVPESLSSSPRCVDRTKFSEEAPEYKLDDEEDDSKEGPLMPGLEHLQTKQFVTQFGAQHQKLDISDGEVLVEKGRGVLHDAQRATVHARLDQLEEPLRHVLGRHHANPLHGLGHGSALSPRGPYGRDNGRLREGGTHALHLDPGLPQHVWPAVGPRKSDHAVFGHRVGVVDGGAGPDAGQRGRVHDEAAFAALTHVHAVHGQVEALHDGDNVDLHALFPAQVHANAGVVDKDVHGGLEEGLGSVVEVDQVLVLGDVTGDEMDFLIAELLPEFLGGLVAGVGVDVRETHFPSLSEQLPAELL